MTHDPKNPSAFPNLAPDSCGPHIDKRDGMTLRDYFAGHALAGTLASWSPADDARFAHQTMPERMAMFADDSYSVADAMLAARSKEPK